MWVSPTPTAQMTAAAVPITRTESEVLRRRRAMNSRTADPHTGPRAWTARQGTEHPSRPRGPGRGGGSLRRGRSRPDRWCLLGRHLALVTLADREIADESHDRDQEEHAGPGRAEAE